MQIEAIKKAIEEDFKKSGCTVKKAVPEGEEHVTDLKAYLMKKYLSKDIIRLTVYVDVLRNGRTNEEIENELKNLKQRTIATISAQAPINVSERVEIKTKYKIM